jgi:hypothetical protein
LPTKPEVESSVVVGNVPVTVIELLAEVLVAYVLVARKIAL